MDVFLGFDHGRSVAGVQRLLALRPQEGHGGKEPDNSFVTILDGSQGTVGRILRDCGSFPSVAVSQTLVLVHSCGKETNNGNGSSSKSCQRLRSPQPIQQVRGPSFGAVEAPASQCQRLNGIPHAVHPRRVAVLVLRLRQAVVLRHRRTGHLRHQRIGRLRPQRIDHLRPQLAVAPRPKKF